MSAQRALNFRCALFDQRPDGCVLAGELGRKRLRRPIEKFQRRPGGPVVTLVGLAAEGVELR